MLLLFQKFEGARPQVLLINLNGNNLGLLIGKALAIQTRNDFQFILNRWPGVFIGWSVMVPQRTWWATLDVGQADRTQHNANREIRKALVNGLGQYIIHPEIRVEELWLY